MKRLSILRFAILLILNSHLLVSQHKILELSNPKKNWVKFFDALQEVHPIDTFIESGTYLGETSIKASRCFKQVHTAELNAMFYTNAVSSLKNYANIHVYHGASPVILKNILPNLNENKILFWLDGHFMSNMPEIVNGEGPVSINHNYTPILEELAEIKNNHLENCLVLIDDIRLFGSTLNHVRVKNSGHDLYPLLQQACDLLTDAGFNYVILGDMILAGNKLDTIKFSPVIQACTVSRCFDGDNYDIEKVMEAEQVIAQAEGEELMAFKELYTEFSMPWANPHTESKTVVTSSNWRNKSPHYNLWYGLILRNNGQYMEACEQFKEVLNLEYTHWRIYWYLADSYYKMQDFSAAKAVLEQLLIFNHGFQPALDMLKLVENHDS